MRLNYSPLLFAREGGVTWGEIILDPQSFLLISVKSLFSLLYWLEDTLIHIISDYACYLELLIIWSLVATYWTLDSFWNSLSWMGGSIKSGNIFITIGQGQFHHAGIYLEPLNASSSFGIFHWITSATVLPIRHQDVIQVVTNHSSPASFTIHSVKTCIRICLYRSWVLLKT